MESCCSGAWRRSSETSRAASSEWPPSSRKKSSRTDTGAGANNFSHTAAICRSSAVRGGTGPRLPSAGRARGAGSFRRSTLPLGRTGSSSRISSSAGTM